MIPNSSFPTEPLVIPGKKNDTDSMIEEEFNNWNKWVIRHKFISLFHIETVRFILQIFEFIYIQDKLNFNEFKINELENIIKNYNFSNKKYKILNYNFLIIELNSLENLIILLKYYELFLIDIENNND